MSAALTGQQLEVLRAVLVGGVLASRDQESHLAALAEINARELGPDWARRWLRDHPEEARDLASRTVRWVIGTRNRKADPDEQRRFWNERCARGRTVLDVSRAAKVSPCWVHQVEQGEIEATRAQMLVLWGLL